MYLRDQPFHLKQTTPLYYPLSRVKFPGITVLTVSFPRNPSAVATPFSSSKRKGSQETELSNKPELPFHVPSLRCVEQLCWRERPFWSPTCSGRPKVGRKRYSRLHP